MKSFHSTILALLAAVAGASAQTTATTTPVGYETLTLPAGLNYVGIRLHNPVLVAGVLSGVTSSTVSDSANTFSLTSGTKYILEINNSGYIQIIDGSAASGSTITTPDNLLSVGVAVGNSYSIRAASTVSSIFGASAPNLVHGFGGSSGADQVWLLDPVSGNFDVYYYDDAGNAADASPTPGWLQDNGDGTFTDENPSNITLAYDDGFIFNSASGSSLVVSGSVKTKPTVLALTGGLNYVGGIYPVGSTIATSFGAAAPNLVHGFGGSSGADQVWVLNAISGNFNVYYYDDAGNAADASPTPGWLQDNGDGTFTDIDSTTISIPSGYIFNASAAENVLAGAPTSYATL